MPTPRLDARSAHQLRPLTLAAHIAPYAGGSVLIGFGQTRVICAATIEPKVPSWMRQQGVSGGWVTAEYSMLPYSTLERKARDMSKGKIDGRTIEIQRLIGRSLRAVIDLEALGQRTLWVDCDVLQADGGTRTAAITGGCVAAYIACRNLVAAKKLKALPVKQLVAAVSVGIVDGTPFLDLNYEEDRNAAVDMNLVITEGGSYVEVQGAGEEAVFTPEQFQSMLDLGREGAARLIDAQRLALGISSEQPAAT